MQMKNSDQGVLVKIAWKEYFAGKFVTKTDKQNYADQNVICSYSTFESLTTSIAILSGSTLALFYSVRFLRCSLSGSLYAVSSTSNGIAFLNCIACSCAASGEGGLVIFQPGYNADFFLDMTSISSCGEIDQNWRTLYVSGGYFETTETNISNCKGSYASTIHIDATHRGTYNKYLKVCSNLCQHKIISYEEPYNIIRSSIIVDNGDDQTDYLIFSSNAVCEYRNSYFDGNTGSSIFYYITKNRGTLFIGCYLQKMFGNSQNNALALTTDPIEKEEFNFEHFPHQLKQDQTCSQKLIWSLHVLIFLTIK